MCTLQVKGGSGRNGGAGGRLGIAYDYINYVGSYFSNGGVGSGGENGAAGTVFTKDTVPGGKKRLRIYNRKGDGVSHFKSPKNPRLARPVSVR